MWGIQPGDIALEIVSLAATVILIPAVIGWNSMRQRRKSLANARANEIKTGLELMQELSGGDNRTAVVHGQAQSCVRATAHRPDDVVDNGSSFDPRLRCCTPAARSSRRSCEDRPRLLAWRRASPLF